MYLCKNIFTIFIYLCKNIYITEYISCLTDVAKLDKNGRKKISPCPLFKFLCFPSVSQKHELFSVTWRSPFLGSQYVM